MFSQTEPLWNASMSQTMTRHKTKQMGGGVSRLSNFKKYDLFYDFLADLVSITKLYLTQHFPNLLNHRILLY